MIKGDINYTSLSSLCEIDVDSQLRHFERTIGEFPKVMPYTRYLNR
jgi:hypothetical protein